MSRFGVKVQLNDTRVSEDLGEVSGNLVVTADEDCRCRQLALYGRLSAAEPAEQEKRSAAKVTLAKWQDWVAGETYTYPFHIKEKRNRSGSNEHDSTPTEWYILPELYFVGDYEPKMPAGWIALNNKLTAASDVTGSQGHSSGEDVSTFVEAAVDEEEGIEPNEDTEVELTRTTASQKLPVEIVFGKLDRNYRIGEQINGMIIVRPNHDCQLDELSLVYQWRTHGRAEIEEGQIHESRLATDENWLAGQTYQYPFSFSIQEGPVTSRGHNQNIDWYIATLVETRPKLWGAFSREEFILLPARAVMDIQQQEDSSIRPLHAHLLWPLGLILLPLIIAGWCYAIQNFGVGHPFGDEQNTNILQGSAGCLFFIAVIGIAFATYKTLSSSITAARYQLAELRTGPVNATITGTASKRGVSGLISFRPKRRAFIRSIVIGLKIREITRTQEGTSVTTRKKTIHQSSGSLDVAKSVNANDLFEKRISITVPRGVPLSRPGYWHSIEWRVELRIRLKRWFDWRREFPVMARPNFGEGVAAERKNQEPATAGRKSC